MNYTLPYSLSTDLYKLRKDDTLTGKYIGAVINDTNIREYDFYGRIKPKNNLNDHKSGYNNFFGYMHPKVVPPNWWAPCFNEKQIRIPIHKF